MPITCDIKFENNPAKVVSAGQPICGKVRLALTERKIVRGVYIQIYGSAFVRWIDVQNERPKEYTGKEVYLNEISYFVGGQPIGILSKKKTTSFDHSI